MVAQPPAESASGPSGNVIAIVSTPQAKLVGMGIGMNTKAPQQEVMKDVRISPFSGFIYLLFFTSSLL
jgi:hypothetical protein